ncbi:S9 family peptidase [Spirosoma endbachense]|uniref:Prolyl oligopeptidase family serine peptidase n=1 Tax=Spirosoma endbachense TaxID=2666025 RepID=A0A6P1VYE6_9BACT|nr:S9 family peptidase [Spirosoma endbachense]QHV96787.1 prolyl oligopeptidase family serine peptidase [Spirosoma endbachense]
MKRQLVPRLLLTVSLSVAAFVVLAGPAPKRAAPRNYTIEQFMKTIRFGGADISPDEQTVLFSSNQDGVFNLYEIPFNGGGQPKQLTFSKTDAIFVIGYLTDGRILYSSDQGGNELNHIYLRERDGAVSDLTPGEKAKFQFGGLSHDRKSFFYQSNQRNKAAFDVFEMDLTTMKPRLIFENPGGFFPGDVSPDKRSIALSRPYTSTNGDVYLYDIQTKENKLLTKHEGEVNNGPEGFSPDSKKLLISTDEGNEFAYVKAYDLSTGQSMVLDKANWDIAGDYLSYKGRYRVLSVNNDARTELKIIDTRTNQPIKLPPMPGGDVTGVNIADSEGRMIFFVNSSNSPSTLFSYDIKSGKAAPLVRGLNPEINADDLVSGEVVRFKSFDGMEVPALLYKPKDVKPGTKLPAILQIHGGPGGQTRLTYSPLTQYLVNSGYVVLAVNNRGSSGYGKTFFAADDRKHGDADLKDCVESKKFLTQTGYVDPVKIGIMGGSYGGYMTLAGLAFTPEEFAVGVDIFGVANWLRTLNSMPEWWGPQREAMFKEIGNPKTDSVALYNKSPLFHTERIKKPLIVIQGANDPRVLKIESDEIVANVKKNGVPVEYVTFPDEGHGFVKKENEITAYKAVKEFLDKYLKGPGQ